MPYQLNKQRSSRKARRVINIHQNRFPKGYVSTLDNSRRPTDSLSDLTNMEVVQDNVVRPRAPLIAYGTQPVNTIIGRMDVRFSGSRFTYWMQNLAGVGKIYKQNDGGAYTLVGGTYDSTAWAGGVQSKGKLYIYNGVNNLSFVTLASGAIGTYTALTTPSISSVVKSGGSGAATHFYRVSANNDVGESIASAVNSVSSAKERDAWIENTDFNTITWAAVAGAASYTIYHGTVAITTNELYTVGSSATSFVDYGTLATNPFKLAPEGNSTQGAIFTSMYVDSKNSQIFGITADNKLYYSAAGTGDFSPFNGGGWVSIDEDGDTTLNYVNGFRNGKGEPVITVSSRGSAGKGKLFHVSFESLTIGSQVIIYPNVYEANGQSGTYAPRATIKARDSLHYPTGQDFRTTGTSQNIVNILTTNTTSQAIEPDIARISLQNLHKAVGVEYRDKLYYALPVGSTENNEIWYQDLSRRGLWVLRWQVAAKDLWLYEDNAGLTHFCALIGNRILEFSRAGSQTHQDDGVAFRSRVAFESLVWDEDGLSLGSVRNVYAKLLTPQGNISMNTSGLTRSGVQTSTGSDNFTTTTTATGYGIWFHSDAHQYGEDPGQINSYGKSVSVLKVKPRGLLNQLDWEVVSTTTGTDYTLSAVNVRGFAIDQLTLRTNS